MSLPPDPPVRIDTLAFGGEGVGTLPSGKKVFVPLAAPGDLVRLEVTEDRGRVARGRIVELVEAGPERVAMPCPHAPVCGGCQVQQVSAAGQLAAKEASFYDALERTGGVPRSEIPRALPIVSSPQPFRYRSRCRLHAEGSALGYRARRAKDLVAIATCPLLEEPLKALALAVIAAHREEPVPGLADVDLSVGADGAGSAAFHLATPAGKRAVRRVEAILAAIPALRGALLVAPGQPTRTFGEPVVRRPAPLAPGIELLSRADLFAQANAEGNERLVAAAVELLGPGPEDEAIELYSGAGNFTFALAGRVAKVTAVEEAGPSLELARRSVAAVSGRPKGGHEAPRPGEGGADPARLASRIRFIAGDAVKVARGFAAEGRRFDLALLDPPRQGAKELPAALAALGPKRIAYVSCDPLTLARDVKALAPHYRVAAARPVDMFPQTYHVEGVVLLAARDRDS